MEQSNAENEVIDLRDALSDVDSMHIEQCQNAPASECRVPAMYKTIFKLSGGTIRTPEQAKKLLIILIVIVNLLTFYLIYKQMGGGQQNVSYEEGSVYSEMNIP